MECTPRARVAEREAAEQAAEQASRVRAAADLARRRADGERISLEDRERPERLHPDGLPETIIVRVLPLRSVTAELPSGETTTMDLDADDPEMTMAGAEVALAALGYTLDRYRLYADMNLMAGKFYLKEGPYDG